MRGISLPSVDRRRFLRRTIEFGAVVAAVAIAVPLLGRLHAHTLSHHWEFPLPAVVLGTIIGLTYGLLGVGLVLVYRTNRIVNFAHGEMGAFGAAFFGIAATKWHIPYWIGFPMGLAMGALVGAAAETGVVRRLRRAPRVMSVVATLGVGQFLAGLAFAINNQAGS